jgi:YVTN family beta-propeller protein
MRPVLLLALAVAGCNAGAPNNTVNFKANCTAGDVSAEAKKPAGKQSDGSVLLPGGRRLTPAGTLLTIGGFPLAMRALPNPGGVERYVVVTDGADGDEFLRLVDLQAPASPVISKVAYPATSSTPQAPSLFYGLALTKDGSKIYVSNGTFDGAPASETDPTKHFNVIQTFSLAGTPPALTELTAEVIHLPFIATSGTARWPAGLQLSADEKTLYSVNQNDGTLSVIDLATHMEIGRTPELGSTPYDLMLAPNGTAAFVSLWGGKAGGAFMFTEGVVTVDLTTPTAPMPVGAPIMTGKAAEQMVMAGGKLYVATSDADAVAVIDPAGRDVTQAAPTAFDASGLWGSAPNALALDATAGRLYVANAGEDAVQAFDLATMKSLGRIPTAWYPTAVAVLSDGTVLIASGKGLGGGPVNSTPNSDFFAGTLQVLPRPSAADLMKGDQQVRDNLTRPHSNEVALTCTGTPRAFPLPADRGGPTPIQHVFLIVRENKTYDAVLGDLQGANGDPSLVLFGADNTPNLHALAQRFVNFDNFYSNAEQSLQGHDWTTASAVNDYGEKIWLNTWGRHTRPTIAFGNSGSGLDHLTTPGSKPIFQQLDAANIAYHNYGEVVNTLGAKFQADTSYPGVFFALGLLDVTKINYVTDNLKDPTFQLEPFSYIGLPNDHTYGTQPGKPTPQSMVADNDEATGNFIDQLSHSPYWASSVVFVIEDDPSTGGDHVEMHRSPCLMVSPWAKTGYVSSAHYDNPSMWKTILLLLGAPSMNLYDGNAAAMYDAFSTTPNLQPYTAIPSKVPPATNSADAPLAAESSAIDWSRPDTAPLDRILWKATHGKDAEPPWGNLRERMAKIDGDDD